jgi:uncharacterized protein YebE (UPF0316 family)
MELKMYVLALMDDDQRPTTVDVEGFLTNPPSPDQVQERGYEAQVWVTWDLEGRVVCMQICYGAPVQQEADWRIDDNDQRAYIADDVFGTEIDPELGR